MPSILGDSRRNIGHASTACQRIVKQLAPIYEAYKDDHPVFAASIIAIIQASVELDEGIKLLDTLILELE